MSQRDDRKFEALLDNPIFTKPELLLLGNARKLILDEKNWVRGRVSTKIGPEADDDPENQMCIQGAIENVVRSNGFDLITKQKAEELVRIACRERQYQHFNDSRSHSEVIRVLTAAIALGMKGNITFKGRKAVYTPTA